MRTVRQALLRATGLGEVNTAQAEYERLADEMWKAQVRGCGVVIIPSLCFAWWLLFWSVFFTVRDPVSVLV